MLYWNILLLAAMWFKWLIKSSTMEWHSDFVSNHFFFNDFKMLCLVLGSLLIHSLVTCRCLTQKLCEDKSITNAFGWAGSPPPFSTNHSFYLLRKDCCKEQKQDCYSVTSQRIKDEKRLALKIWTAVCLKRHDPRKQRRFIECSLKPTKYIEIYTHVMENCTALNCVVCH